MFVLILSLVFSRANAQSFDFYEANSLKTKNTITAINPGSESVSASTPASTATVKPSSASAPVIVFVHGGAWVSRSKATYRPLGEALAKQGYCVAVVDYELAPQAKHPKQVDQVEAALTELAKQKHVSCNMDRWYLVGHSAGAHMISFWDSKYSNQRVKGFIGLEGIYDIPKLVERWPEYKGEFIEAEFGEAAKWVAASPARLKMKSKAPWLIIQSEQDELVEMAQSTAFADHLKAEKIPVDLRVIKALSHFGAVDSLGDTQSEAAQALRAFTDKAK